MQPSCSTTTSSAVSQVTKAVTPDGPDTMNYTESTRTKPSKISQITHPLKKASSKFGQKLQKLGSRVSKSKAVSEQSEKPVSTCTSSPKAVDVEKTNKDEAKKARRDARRAKWAARRESLKELGRKAQKAVEFMGIVILSFIFGPIIVVLELTLTLVIIVISLLLQLIEIICAPFLVCLDW